MFGCLSVACAGSGDANGTGPATFGNESASSSGTAASTTGDDGLSATSGVSTSTTPADGTTAGSDGGPGDSGTTGGGAVSCRDDPAACTAWILPAGSKQWSPVALDVDSNLAPAGPVRAAFDIEDVNEGVVLTDTHYYVVDLITREWVRSASRAVDLPELGNDEILGAYAIPGYWGEMFGGSPDTVGVGLQSASNVYLYDYDIPSESFTFVEAISDFGPAWATPEAPSPAEVRATWLDVSNEPGWWAADIAALCGGGQDGAPGPYSATIGADAVHLSDAGYCFAFDTPIPFEAFTPFSYPQAPAVEQVAAAFYSELAGLWIFAEG
jgi:hypothetical protein